MFSTNMLDIFRNARWVNFGIESQRKKTQTGLLEDADVPHGNKRRGAE